MKIPSDTSNSPVVPTGKEDVPIIKSRNDTKSAAVLAAAACLKGDAAGYVALSSAVQKTVSGNGPTPCAAVIHATVHLPSTFRTILFAAWPLLPYTWPGVSLHQPVCSIVAPLAARRYCVLY